MENLWCFSCGIQQVKKGKFPVLLLPYIVETHVPIIAVAIKHMNYGGKQFVLQRVNITDPSYLIVSGVCFPLQAHTVIYDVRSFPCSIFYEGESQRNLISKIQWALYNPNSKKVGTLCKT